MTETASTVKRATELHNEVAAILEMRCECDVPAICEVTTEAITALDELLSIVLRLVSREADA